MYYRARALALNNGQRYHIAAILRRKNKVIEIATNSHKTHPACGRAYADGTMGYSMHAEMSVLRFSKPGDSIEVLRFGKLGNLTMAKPCNNCRRMMKFANIRSVRFTNPDGIWEVFRLYG